MKYIVAILFAVAVLLPTASQATPAPSLSTRISPAEQRWLNKTGELSQTLGKALSKIGKTLSDPVAVQRLLLGDQDEIAKLVVPVVTLQQCPTLLSKGVGRPPTRRLVRTYNLLKRMCAHFRQSGLLFVRGFDNRNATTLTRAAMEMREGSNLIVRATREIKRIR